MEQEMDLDFTDEEDMETTTDEEDMDNTDDEDMDNTDDEYALESDFEYGPNSGELDARYKRLYTQCKTDELRTRLSEMSDTERHQLVKRKHNDVDNPIFVFVRREVWKLLKHWVDINLKNRVCEDILRMICLLGHEDIFQYLMEYVTYSPDTVANAHELIGAFYLSKESPKRNPQILKHWKEALRIRRDNGIQITEQIPLNPLPFGHPRELDTEAELDLMASSLEDMLIQAVHITRRILGVNNPFTFDVEFNVIMNYYENKEFEGCFKFMFYHLNKDNHDNDDFYLEVTSKITFVAARIYLENAEIVGVDHESVKFDEAMLIVNVQSAQMESQNVKETTLYYLTTMLDLLFRMPKNDTQQQIFMNVIRNVVQKKFCDNVGCSALHIASSNAQPSYLLCINDDLYDYQYPRAPFIRLLLECGHDVDALERSKFSPLHLAVRGKYDVDVVNCLLEHGAHIDRATVNGFRPCRLLDTVHSLNTFQYVTLKCLAARTIVDKKVPYNGINFPALEDFIKMH